ncbi:YcgL domain-containing protein [Guyparkeria halopsychrophila]|uniref:YcgL domain-containing protein n=1 Tax=Guyparkeria halopsychrophila TaxID=3139421 RepID=UPI0037CC7095
MQAHIFKSRKNPDMYLFVREGQDMDELDPMVLDRLGELEFVMELDLSEDRPLARSDAATVRDHIEKLGFHLQMPPSAENWAHWDNLKAGIRAGRPQSE